MVEPFASLPAASASGDLTKTPISHLLLYAYDRKLSGTIELSASPEETATVIFAEGLPVKAHTSEPVAYLGYVLVELGWLDETQRADTLESARLHKLLHGQVLRSRGLVLPEQLEAGLRAQLVRKLRYLTRLPASTEFRYYADVDALSAYGGEIRVAVDPHPIVWAHIREAPSRDHMKAVLARVGDASLRVASGADLARFELDAAEQATAELLYATPCTVSDVMTAGLVDPRLAQRLLYCLIASKQVEVPGEAAPLSTGRSFAPSSIRAPSTVSGSMPAVQSSVARHASAAPKPTTAPPQRPAASVAPVVAPNYDDAGGGGFVQKREMFEIVKEQSVAIDPCARGAESYQHAQQALASGDLEKAVACGKSATLDEPGSAEYLALYGWALGLRAEKHGQTPTDVAIETEIAIEKIDTALRRNPRLVEGYYHLYVLKKRLGGEDEAVDDLRRAIELSPGKVDWQRELRLIEMRKHKEQEQREKEQKDGKGLLGKVFKK